MGLLPKLYIINVNLDIFKYQHNCCHFLKRTRHNYLLNLFISNIKTLSPLMSPRFIQLFIYF